MRRQSSPRGRLAPGQLMECRKSGFIIGAANGMFRIALCSVFAGLPEKRFYDWRGQRHVSESRSAASSSPHGLGYTQVLSSASTAQMASTYHRFFHAVVHTGRTHQRATPVALWLPLTCPIGRGCPAKAGRSCSILAGASGGTEECMYHPGAKEQRRYRAPTMRATRH